MKLNINNPIVIIVHRKDLWEINLDRLRWVVDQQENSHPETNDPEDIGSDEDDSNEDKQKSRWRKWLSEETKRELYEERRDNSTESWITKRLAEKYWCSVPTVYNIIKKYWIMFKESNEY